MEFVLFILLLRMAVFKITLIPPRAQCAALGRFLGLYLESINSKYAMPMNTMHS